MRIRMRSWICSLCLLWALPAFAQETPEDKQPAEGQQQDEKKDKAEKDAGQPATDQQPDTAGEQAAEGPAGQPAEEARPEAPVESPAVVSGTGDEEEEVIFERLTGLYFEGRGGVFFTLGGARKYSNGQPLFGFELGYDLSDQFSLQLAVEMGYQAANPLMYPEECSGDACRDYHLDFGITMFNLSADYDLFAGRRWAVELRAGGGAALINPSAKPEQSSVDFDVFGGLRFEYYTLLRHFSVAAEYDFYYIMPTNIPAMGVSVSILYNF